MELLDALRLQWEWGADEALLDTPQDHRRAVEPAPPIPIKAKQPVGLRAASPSTLAGPEEAARQAAACNSLEELENTMRKFEGCALKQTATQLVFADGPETARIMMIGEAPGGEEDRVGKPFAGPAGQLLDKMLASIGLDRTTVRIINAIPWRPPGNRTPTETEIALCRPFLHRHIALVAPLGLVTLGAVATKALLATEAQAGIRRLRGQWRDVKIEGLSAPTPCLPTYHPAYLLRMPNAKKESWQDFLTLCAWQKNQAQIIKNN